MSQWRPKIAELATGDSLTSRNHYVSKCKSSCRNI